MIKKLDEEEFSKFWKEFGTSIKLGLIEDYSNRTRLAKLLRFASSNDAEGVTSLESYVERMKKNQEHIYFMAGGSRKEAETSPFVERLLKRGYEVIYLVEPVDEYVLHENDCSLSVGPVLTAFWLTRSSFTILYFFGEDLFRSVRVFSRC